MEESVADIVQDFRNLIYELSNWLIIECTCPTTNSAVWSKSWTLEALFWISLLGLARLASPSRSHRGKWRQGKGTQQRTHSIQCLWTTTVLKQMETRIQRNKASGLQTISSLFQHLHLLPLVYTLSSSKQSINFEWIVQQLWSRDSQKAMKQFDFQSQRLLSQKFLKWFRLWPNILKWVTNLNFLISAFLKLASCQKHPVPKM